MTLSKSGDRLTILDAPPQLTEQLGIALRANFPRKITTDRATDDGLHVFEVRKGSYGGALRSYDNRLQAQHALTRLPRSRSGEEPTDRLRAPVFRREPLQAVRERADGLARPLQPGPAKRDVGLQVPAANPPERLREAAVKPAEPTGAWQPGGVVPGAPWSTTPSRFATSFTKM